jgi:hypothetical protein
MKAQAGLVPKEATMLDYPPTSCFGGENEVLIVHRHPLVGEYFFPMPH